MKDRKIKSWIEKSLVDGLFIFLCFTLFCHVLFFIFGTTSSNYDMSAPVEFHIEFIHFVSFLINIGLLLLCIISNSRMKMNK